MNPETARLLLAMRQLASMNSRYYGGDVGRDPLRLVGEGTRPVAQEIDHPFGSKTPAKPPAARRR